MTERRPGALVFVAGAVLTLMALLLAWSVWPSRGAPIEAARVAARAMPDIRPRLPENPRLPTPMPAPR